MNVVVVHAEDQSALGGQGAEAADFFGAERGRFLEEDTDAEKNPATVSRWNVGLFCRERGGGVVRHKCLLCVCESNSGEV